MSNDPSDAINKLAARAAEVLKPLGLEMVGFGIQASLQGGPTVGQIVIELADIPDETDPDTAIGQDPEVDKAFEELMRDQKRFEDEQKAAEAAEQLKGWLQE